jgi:hypothetical protein
MNDLFQGMGGIFRGMNGLFLEMSGGCLGMFLLWSLLYVQKN